MAKLKPRVGRKRAQFEVMGSILVLAVTAVVGYTVWFALDSRQAADTAYDAAIKASQSKTVHARQSNIVEDAGKGSASLVAFLRADDTGCWRSGEQGWFRIVKEVNDSQATLEYGCSETYDDGNGTPSRMLVHKVDGKWKIISPTNQWSYTVPSCTMLQANDILTALEPQCWTKQNLDGTTIMAFNRNSQYADSYESCLLASGSRTLLSFPPICVTEDGLSFPQ